MSEIEELHNVQLELSKFVSACYFYLNGNGIKPNTCIDMILDTVNYSLQKTKEIDQQEYNKRMNE